MKGYCGWLSLGLGIVALVAKHFGLPIDPAIVDGASVVLCGTGAKLLRDTPTK